MSPKIQARLEQYYKRKQYREALLFLKNLPSDSNVTPDEQALIKKYIQSFRYELWKKKLESFQVQHSLDCARKFCWITLVSLGFFLSWKSFPLET